MWTDYSADTAMGMLSVLLYKICCCSMVQETQGYIYDMSENYKRENQG